MFIRAIETGVPLEAMTVMAIISALNDAGHPQLAEGVFCCAFASALALQPLLTRSWPQEQQELGLKSGIPLAMEHSHGLFNPLPAQGSQGAFPCLVLSLPAGPQRCGPVSRLFCLCTRGC